jgi:hypothetical protein
MLFFGGGRAAERAVLSITFRADRKDSALKSPKKNTAAMLCPLCTSGKKEKPSNIKTKKYENFKNEF